ncbi:hypothetical protein PGT21_021566 [Puccinia graminis f. sp. tritici]|uniref:Uncharacterized protein n=1 Tax=Puccinia graminis f. sp. tritici TaxID=56615 RepID=A0A5B0QB71_PUCGR|nr:hypothetical protein PGT21_021566 [Puccinia graminis f. sp. tritici]
MSISVFFIDCVSMITLIGQTGQMFISTQGAAQLLRPYHDLDINFDTKYSQNCF